MADLTTTQLVTEIKNQLKAKAAKKADLESGAIVPMMSETLQAWADQKAIATPDTYTDAVRTTGGDIPIETSAGSKLESIKPIAGSKWTTKLLFNGSYNMLNAAKWGAANSQPYVGGVGSNFVYFLVPELTLGTFGTADENNGLLFTDSEGENVQPTSVYFKPLGATVPQSLTDGTSVSPTSVSYDGKTYKDYATSGAGWLIIPKSYYDNDVCAHIAWEDWYDKHVSLDEPNTNPEAVVGILILEGLLALAHADKYLRGVNEEVCDNVVFGDTSATVTHMVDEISVAANAWTNSATGESDSQGNALYRHSATVSGIKNGGASCVEGEDGGITLTVNGTTVSYIDTNASAPASTVFYEVAYTSTTKAYTDSIFNGSNVNQETGVLPINDCSIEAQVAMDGKADITVKYAKNIVDQVAINATVDVPQIKKQVEEHEERITDLEDTAVRTGSYDASVAVGLADNFKGDTIVDAEFYKRKTGGTQSVGSGIAAINEVRGKSIVWNQKAQYLSSANYNNGSNGGASIVISDGTLTFTSNGNYFCWASLKNIQPNNTVIHAHKYLLHYNVVETNLPTSSTLVVSPAINKPHSTSYRMLNSIGVKNIITTFSENSEGIIGGVGVSSKEGAALPTGSRCVIKDIMLFDLTLMFGGGNEPATGEEFEKMFPLDNYDYNAGEVIPFAGQNLVTIGFNMLKLTGRTERTSDYSTPSNVKPLSENIYINGISINGYVQSPQKVTQLNITESSVSGVGRNSAYGIGFPIRVEENVTYYVKGSSRISLYNKEKLFARTINGNTFTTQSGEAWAVIIFGISVTDFVVDEPCANISSDRNGTYEPYEKHTLSLDTSQWRDKQSGELVFPYGGMHGVGTAYDYAKVGADGYIRKAVRVFERRACESGDTELANVITDGTTYTFYPLETPIEVELATPVYAKYLVDKYGTEEITPANGTKPYTTMANLSILYAMDARGEINGLPKNYLSKESAENMLNAMVSAGIIASYTMTYDAANGRYAFVITAPEPKESNE